MCSENLLSIKTVMQLGLINSLVPGRLEWNFRYVNVSLISVTDGWGISCEIALRWMLLDFIDDKSTPVQVMAWCLQATSHYLNQCWRRSMSPHGVNGPQRVNTKSNITWYCIEPGILLCMGSAIERQLYIVTSSFIGWAQTQSRKFRFGTHKGHPLSWPQWQALGCLFEIFWTKKVL